MRGVTAIIATIILVLIAISLVSGAYIFLNNYLGNVISKTIILQQSFCTDKSNIILKNTGTTSIALSSTKLQTENYLSNSNTLGLWHFDENDGNKTGDSSSNSNTGTLRGDTLALWHFDDGTGQKIKDQTTFSNDGTLGSTAGSDASDPTWISGNNCISGSCLEFDGVDDNVTVPMSSSLGISGSITISMWIKPGTGSGAFEPLIESVSGHTLNRILLVNGAPNIDTFTVQFEIGMNNANWYTPPINRNVPVHIAYTFDGSVERFYINGTLATSHSKPGNIVTGGEAIKIGFSESYSDYFSGIIDEVAIYNRSLTAGEISGLYNSRKAKFIEWVRPKIGQSALEFDGIDDYVNLGSNTNLDVSTFTIDMWIKPLSLHYGGQYQNIIMGREFYTIPVTSGSGFRYGIATSGQVHFWTTQSGGSLSLNSGDTFLSPGNFYHLIVTYDGTTQTGNMYINGNLAGTATGTYVVPSGRNLVINGGIGGTTGSNSIIDEVRILNRALTEQEIKDQQEWKYACPATGQSVICSDLTIAKGAGNIDPYFTKSSFGPGESVTIKDNQCIPNDGLCEYRVSTRSNTIKTSVYC